MAILALKFTAMTLTQLQYIVAVDNHRHFGKAAESCHVTQPTLSMQIQKLEEELEVLIFNRNLHPVEPTALGKELLKQARKTLEEAERIQELVYERRGKMEGTFRLGIIPTVAGSLLPLILPGLAKDLNGVEWVVEELQTEQILDRLGRETLDAGIMATPLGERNLLERPLYFEPFTAFVPDGHRLSGDAFILPSELDSADLLLLQEGHCFRNNVLNICGKQGGGPISNVRLESGSFDTLVAMAKKGLGMTLLPYLAAAALPREDHRFVKPLGEPRPVREISLVYPASMTKSVLAGKLVDLIRQAVPAKLLESGLVVSPR
jgi:LysR family hydrogen peroxide-inducible transcriptional activator